MARFGKKPKDNTGAGNPLAGYGEKPKPNTGAGNPVARFGTPEKPPAGGGSGRKASKPATAPVSAAAQAKAAKAQSSAKRYAQVQRSANKAKRAVNARKGPQDLAGREQRKMDLARYRKLQAGADSWKDKARGQGLRFGGDKPAGNKPQPAAQGSRGGGGSSGGGSSSAGNAVARATGSQARPTANPTRPQAPKAGSVLANARKLKDGGKGTPISAKELSAFMKFYNANHKGTLSRSDAVMMARLLKSKNPSVAKKYGLNVATEN